MKVSLYKAIDIYRNKPLTTTLLPLPHRAEPHTHPPSSPCESPPQNSTDMSSWSSLYTPRLGAESWGILNGMPEPNLQRTNWDIEKTMMKHVETCCHTSQGSHPNFPQHWQHARKPVPCRTCVLQIDLPWPLKNQYEYRTNSTPAPKRSISEDQWWSMAPYGSNPRCLVRQIIEVISQAFLQLLKGLLQCSRFLFLHLLLHHLGTLEEWWSLACWYVRR